MPRDATPGAPPATSPYDHHDRGSAGGDTDLSADTELWRRAAAGDRTAFGELFERHVEADHADAVAGRVDDDRGTRRALAAIRALPRAEREAVELCLLGELSTADAAAVAGVAEVSIRSRLSRARARLRTLLEEKR